MVFTKFSHFRVSHFREKVCEMRQKTFALFRETFRSLETLRLTKRKFRAPIYFLYCFPVRQCFLNLIIPLDN